MKAIVMNSSIKHKFTVTPQAMAAVKAEWQLIAAQVLRLVAAYKLARATLNKGTTMAMFNTVRAQAKRMAKQEKQAREQLNSLRSLYICGGV